MAIDWDAHRHAAIEEDIEFLRQNGLTDERIEQRLGIKLDSRARTQQRAKRKEREHE